MRLYCGLQRFVFLFLARDKLLPMGHSTDRVVEDLRFMEFLNAIYQQLRLCSLTALTVE